MTYRIILILFSLFLFSSCKEESTPIQQQHGALGLSALKWNPSNFPTGNSIQISLSEEFETEVIGAPDDLSSATLDILNKWDGTINGIEFFNDQINIVPNLAHQNLEAYFETPSEGVDIGVYLSHDWFQDIPSGVVAITQYYAVQKQYRGTSYLELIHADIIFNTRNHSFSLDPDDYANYHFQSVLMHELGHLLGLNHNFNYASGSIMVPSFSSFYAQEELSAADRKMMTSKYSLFTSSGGLNSINLSQSKSNSMEGLRGKQIIRGISYLRKDGTCTEHNSVLKNHAH